MIRHVFAILFSLGAVSPAVAFDINTLDAVVTIEDDEVGFVVVGKKIVRQLGPGLHQKLPIIEQVAVITTSVDRSESVRIRSLPSAEVDCLVTLDATYEVADARRAFLWRRDNGLDSTQQRRYFADARDDYAAPRARMTQALTALVDSLTPRQAMCGGVDAWARHDPDGLLDTINFDGTAITHLHALAQCESAQPVRCARLPRISTSSSSSDPDTPRHR